MSQVKNAKDALLQAITTFKFTKTAVSNALNAEKINTRSLTTKLKNFQESLSAVNAAHTTWVAKAELTPELLSKEDHSSTWLETIWAKHNELSDMAEDILSDNSEDVTPPIHNNKQKLTICIMQMESLQNDIIQKMDNLHRKCQGEININSHTLYTQILNSISINLGTEFNQLSEQILLLDSANLEDNLKQHDNFRQKYKERLLALQLHLAEKTPTATRPGGFEMEKSKAPTFSGRTIDYPEFKRGWTKTAGIRWDDGNQVEQIKLKVNDQAKRIISRCNSMKEVWETLDLEYAQEQEVINAVDAELKVLRLKVCSTPEYIVDLRNYLPCLEEALRSVSGLEHLTSPSRVDFMAAKFDELTMRDWEYFRTKTTGTTYARFFEFLKDRYESSRSTIARLRRLDISYNTDDSQNNTATGLIHRVDAQVCQRCDRWIAREGVYTCPACGRGTPEGEMISHCLEHCGKYLSMNVNKRSACVETAGWCPIHLLGGHNLETCNMRNNARSLCGINSCNKHHHKSLHGSTSSFVANINLTQLSTADELMVCNESNVLLLYQSIKTTSGSINCFFDNGSSCCLITITAATRLCLFGEPVTLTITTVNGKEHIESFAYSVTLIDSNHQTHIITAYGIVSISNDIQQVDISSVEDEFSEDVHCIWKHLEDRPHGEIELLVGMNQCGIHPGDVKTSGNLKIMSSIFGNGYLLVGAHPSIKTKSVEWNETVTSIRSSNVTFMSHVVHRTSISVKPRRDFFETEGFGVAPPRRCGNCRNCTECSFRAQQLSQEKQYELQVIESKVKYNEAQQCFYVEYPFIQDPNILSNNHKQVVKIAEREEKRLEKEGLLDRFNDAFDNMISHNALVELKQEEIDMWDGPVHYVSTQHVVNEESPTTSLRIVTNSSLSDKNGVSVNSICMKGPNTLSDQWDILTRWRMYEVALCSDVTKAYFSIQTGEVEKHIRRIVWRYGKSNEKWRIFAFRTISFGDRPAASILEIVIKRTAKLFGSIDPEAAQKIISDRYVDDFASGGFKHQVDRFVGNELSTFQYDGTFPSILNKGSLKLKTMVTSGESNQEKIDKLGKGVLGTAWNPTSDRISIAFNISVLLVNLTMRSLLGMINRIYDVLGLCAPFNLRLKVAFRNLFAIEPKLAWDDPIPSHQRELWIFLMEMMISAKEISFLRATRPIGAVGKSQLICYFDGSDDAFSGVLYVRWSLADGSVAVILMGSKSRVTPLIRISTPRSEINGAVLASRLVLSTLRSLSVSGELPERVWMIGDSECTLSSLEKVSAPFGEYFGNRVGEIFDNQSQIEKFCTVGNDGEWWFTESKNNGADMATRLDTNCEDLRGKRWQEGDEYLKLPREQWPLTRSFIERKDDFIPQSELLKRYRAIVHHINATDEKGIQQLVDPYITNSWEFLISKTQALLVWHHQYKYGTSASASTLSHAKRLWYKSTMHETCKALDQGKLKELDVRDDDGLKVVVGRAEHGLKKFFGQNSLPIIMGHTRVAYLIMLHAHYQDHCGKDITMATARHEAWIVSASKLAKQITKNCIRCRFLRKRLEGQKMAVLPAEIQGYCKPFTNLGLDLCGPYTVKSMTNKRACLKVWITIFVCLNTKAVSMELAPGYSTEDFLLAYTNQTEQRGVPSMVHSDQGSQLVAAQKQLGEVSLNYDWDAIANASARKGTTWKFTPPGSQWRNGATEAFVKKFKASFYHLYKDTKLNYAQLLTAIKRIANILNHRPVSVQRTKNDTNDEDFLVPLTPNHLILGNNGTDPPSDYVDVQDPHASRTFIDELERAWWYQYKIQYFHSLLPTRKWADKQRNMIPGDIVLIQYASKSAPGTYRLGRVKDVEVDEDGLVRTCNVVYKLIKPVNEQNRNTVDDVVTKEIRTSVQRLVLILPHEEQS